MKDLNRRNTETVEEVVKDMYNRIQDQHIRIDQLSVALTNMTERLNTLEKMLIIQKASSIGTGPSVK